MKSVSWKESHELMRTCALSAAVIVVVALFGASLLAIEGSGDWSRPKPAASRHGPPCSLSLSCRSDQAA